VGFSTLSDLHNTHASPHSCLPAELRGVGSVKEESLSCEERGVRGSVRRACPTKSGLMLCTKPVQADAHSAPCLHHERQGDCWMSDPPHAAGARYVLAHEPMDMDEALDICLRFEDFKVHPKNPPKAPRSPTSTTPTPPRGGRTLPSSHVYLCGRTGPSSAGFFRALSTVSEGGGM
jgi:hypothetical protein